MQTDGSAVDRLVIVVVAYAGVLRGKQENINVNRPIGHLRGEQPRQCESILLYRPLKLLTLSTVTLSTLSMNADSDESMLSFPGPRG